MKSITGTVDYTPQSFIASSPSSVLICGWIRNPDYANSTWPYSRGNVDFVNVYGGTTTNNNWNIQAIVCNSSAASATDTNAEFNANTMLFASGSQYVGDYSYYYQAGHTTAQIMSWIFCAVQVVISGTDLLVKQWIRFGLAGTTLAVSSSTITQSEVRTETGNASWVAGALNRLEILPSSTDPSWRGPITRLRVYDTSTEPTTAQLDAIAEMDALDTTSALSGVLWADWPYEWLTGAAVLTDRSGNGRSLTAAGGQTLMESIDGPAFEAGGATIDVSGASAGVATAAGALQARVSLSGTSIGVAAASGALSGLTAMQGASTGASAQSGALSVASSMAAASAGIATESASLSGRSSVAANSNGAASAAGALLGLAAMAAVSLGVATASGTLSTSSTAGLSGTSQGASVATADVRGMATLSGSSAGSSTQSANLTATAPDALAGTSAGTSTTTGSLRGLSATSGTSSSVATASGSLLALSSLAGTSAGSSAQTGSLLVASLLSGQSASSATASATLSGLSRFVGVSVGASTCSGSVALIGAGVVTGGSVTFAVGSVGSLVATVTSLGSISMTRLNS